LNKIEITFHKHYGICKTKFIILITAYTKLLTILLLGINYVQTILIMQLDWVIEWWNETQEFRSPFLCNKIILFIFAITKNIQKVDIMMDDRFNAIKFW